MCIFSILHTTFTNDVLLRNLTKVWMNKEEFIQDWFSFLTRTLVPKK